MSEFYNKKEEVIEQPVAVAEPKKQTPKVVKPEWEVKDRTYLLRGNKTPLTLTIPGKHTRKHPRTFYKFKRSSFPKSKS